MGLLERRMTAVCSLQEKPSRLGFSLREMTLGDGCSAVEVGRAKDGVQVLQQ